MIGTLRPLHLFEDQVSMVDWSFSKLAASVRATPGLAELVPWGDFSDPPALYDAILDEASESSHRVQLCHFALACRDAAAVPFLEGGLGSRTEVVREASAYALSELGDGQSCELLRLRLAVETSSTVRSRIAYAIGCIALRVTVDQRAMMVALAALLDNSREAVDVRAEAANALTSFDGTYFGHRPAPHVKRALIAGLYDPEPTIRFWSAFALHWHGDLTSAVHLLGLAKRDRSDTRFLPESVARTVAEEAAWAADIVITRCGHRLVFGRQFRRSASGEWVLQRVPRGGARK